MNDDHPGQGKIQRAPHALRMALNLRLQNGALGPELLPWLNSQPEIQAICRDYFAGAPVNEQNLSSYRTGAYRKWLATARSVERQRQRAEVALELAKASGPHLSTAAAQLVAGAYLDAFSAAQDAQDGGDEDAIPEPIDPKVAMAVVALKKADQQDRALDLKQQDGARRDRELDQKEENNATAVAAKVLKALREQAIQRIDTSPGDDEAKMDDITRIIYGDELMERIRARRQAALDGTDSAAA